MMEFHVWNLNPRMEVQLSKEMIQRIHAMTKRKRILYEDKEEKQRCGWKKPHKRRFYVWRNAKILPYTWPQTNGLHKIAERLYAERDWHGSDRPMSIHKPYINLNEFCIVSKVTKIPMRELEKSVVSVRNNNSRSEVALTFPVVANADWAWLFGFYSMCGGQITRDRIGKGGYATEERGIRFAVEPNVFLTKLQPLLERIGYRSWMRKVWYEKYTEGHPLDKQRRRGTGNSPRKFVTIPRVIREVMEYFGLPPVQKRKNLLQGRMIGTRKLRIVVPSWIKKGHFEKAYIEAVLNGGQTSSQFRVPKDGRGISRMVELRVGGQHKQEVDDMMLFFKKQLLKFGITGTVHRIRHRKTEQLYWNGFQIYNHASLARLFEEFDIQHPAIRARLCVHYFMNALVYALCKRLVNIEIIILGTLMEHSRSEQEIKDLLRLRTDQVQTTLNKLQKLDIVQRENGLWRLMPTGCKQHVLNTLRQEDEAQRSLLMRSNGLFFSKCNECGNVIPHNYKGKCACGGVFEPVERKVVLKGYWNQKYAAIIAKILNEEMPVLSE